MHLKSKHPQVSNYKIQILKLYNKAVFGYCKTISGKYIFSGNANFWKRKMYVWFG